MEINDEKAQIRSKVLSEGGESVTTKDDGGGKRKKKKSLEATIQAWLEKKKSGMMVVASLIATMGFQIGVNPPGGVWQQDNFLTDSTGNYVDPVGNNISKPVDGLNISVIPKRAGCAVLAHTNPSLYKELYIYNTIGFISSLSIIFLLVSGLPVRSRFFMWVLMVITWIAITATAMTYNAAMRAVTPKECTTEAIIQYSLYAWIGLTLVIFIAHVMRVLLRLIKTLFRGILKCCTCARAARLPV